MPRIVAIIQARMGSSRLPGKVLKDIGGQPMLARVVDRTRRAKTIDAVVVATTTDPGDDQIESVCCQRGYICVRGSVFDVLDRYYQAALQAKAEVVVRITSDCPLIMPEEIDHTVKAYLDSGVDFAANRLPDGRTVPIGLDTEVCSFQMLERAWRDASQPFEREHVMPYLYDQPGRFKVLRVDSAPDLGTLRWAVDTPQDLLLVQKIYELLGNRDDFNYQEVINVWNQHPELSQINAEVVHKKFNDVDQRFKAK